MYFRSETNRKSPQKADQIEATEDHEHAQTLKDFVPDHPHLHELVDKTHQGDLEAKHRFERESLSVRCMYNYSIDESFFTRQTCIVTINLLF